jgi:hypothetical protein
LIRGNHDKKSDVGICALVAIKHPKQKLLAIEYAGYQPVLLEEFIRLGRATAEQEA